MGEESCYYQRAFGRFGTLLIVTGKKWATREKVFRSLRLFIGAHGAEATRPGAGARSGQRRRVIYNTLIQLSTITTDSRAEKAAAVAPAVINPYSTHRVVTTKPVTSGFFGKRTMDWFIL